MRDEHEYWNTDAGRRWATDADRLDAQLEAIGRVTLEAAALEPGQRVLDIGCGAGWSTIEAARRVAPGGLAVGVDVSSPLLAVARRRARRHGATGVTFLDGDGQTAAPPPGRFDRAISRFGVMFFADTVAAFRNIARRLEPGGRLAFCCWGHPDDNPWMSLPRAAAARHVALPPQVDPAVDDEPGPFRLADVTRTTAALAAAGFRDARVTVAAGRLLVGGPGDLDEAAAFSMRIGPAASATRDIDDATRRRVAAAVRESLEPHAEADGVRMAYTALVVTATAPD